MEYIFCKAVISGRAFRIVKKPDRRSLIFVIQHKAWYRIVGKAESDRGGARLGKEKTIKPFFLAFGEIVRDNFALLRQCKEVSFVSYDALAVAYDDGNGAWIFFYGKQGNLYRIKGSHIFSVGKCIAGYADPWCDLT